MLRSAELIKENFLKENADTPEKLIRSYFISMDKFTSSDLKNYFFTVKGTENRLLNHYIKEDQKRKYTIDSIIVNQSLTGKTATVFLTAEPYRIPLSFLKWTALSGFFFHIHEQLTGKKLTGKYKKTFDIVQDNNKLWKIENCTALEKQ